MNKHLITFIVLIITVAASTTPVHAQTLLQQVGEIIDPTTPPEQSPEPTIAPTPDVTASPTVAPTTTPTVAPTSIPPTQTPAPTVLPSILPTPTSTPVPTTTATIAPTVQPTATTTNTPTPTNNSTNENSSNTSAATNSSPSPTPTSIPIAAQVSNEIQNATKKVSNPKNILDAAYYSIIQAPTMEEPKNSYVQSYYSDRRLSPLTTRRYIYLGLSSIIIGVFLYFMPSMRIRWQVAYVPFAHIAMTMKKRAPRLPKFPRIRI